VSTGRCLCGAVRYEVRGALRDVVVCHCEECRRWHGQAGAYASTPREGLVVVGEASLRWIDSPRSAAHARRGFCGTCGSSLFWDAPGRETVGVAAGTLDAPTGLRTIRHVYRAQAADWEQLPDAEPPSG